MKHLQSTLSLVLILGWLLACILTPTPVLAVPSGGDLSSFHLEDIGTDFNGNAVNVNITWSGFPPSTEVRVDKEVLRYASDGSTLVFPIETRSVWADIYGFVYFADPVAVPETIYNYRFTAVDGRYREVKISTSLTTPTPNRRGIRVVIESSEETEMAGHCPADVDALFEIGDKGIALWPQIGYTRATTDLIIADETNISLGKDVVFTVVNGPNCDLSGARWLQIVTESTDPRLDQIMYVRENLGTMRLLHPLGEKNPSVVTGRILPSGGWFWTPLTDRFNVEMRTAPTWCQTSGNDDGPVVRQATFGTIYRVISITKDQRWVEIDVGEFRTLWVSTHLGNINFHSDYLSYGNYAGPITTVGPVINPAWERQPCD